MDHLNGMIFALLFFFWLNIIGFLQLKKKNSFSDKIRVMRGILFCWPRQMWAHKNLQSQAATWQRSVKSRAPLPRTEGPCLHASLSSLSSACFPLSSHFAPSFPSSYPICPHSFCFFFPPYLNLLLHQNKWQKRKKKIAT